MFIKTIPQGHCLVVERFGKPVRVAHSGLKVFIPFLDKPKDVGPIWEDKTNKPDTDGKRIFIELSEQQRDTKPQDCFTKDNVKLSVDCVYRWRIVDPLKAIYEVDKLHNSIREAVLSEARAFIGQNDLNFVLGARSQLSDHVVSAVEGTVSRWGVKLTGLEVAELKTDGATEDAMRQQLEASRKAEAIRLESEGRAAAIVKLAEAEKTAMALKAEGDESYLKSLSGVVGYKNAAKILITIKTLESYKIVTENAANKVFMPLQTLPEILTSENVNDENAPTKE